MCRQHVCHGSRFISWVGKIHDHLLIRGLLISSANHGPSILLKPFNGLYTIIRATLEIIIIKVSFIRRKKKDNQNKM